jgi:hypothetical protein
VRTLWVIVFGSIWPSFLAADPSLAAQCHLGDESRGCVRTTNGRLEIEARPF